MNRWSFSEALATINDLVIVVEFLSISESFAMVNILITAIVNGLLVVIGPHNRLKLRHFCLSQVATFAWL